MRIADIDIGTGNPCRFIAELSCNHGGSLDRMYRLLDAAKAAGATFAKTQAYTPDELCALRGDGPAPEPWGSQGYSMRSLYERARTPLEWFPKIAQHCADIGMPWLSSVFGPESLACLEAVGCVAYKVARLDNTQGDLREMVFATGKPILVSGATIEEMYLWRNIPTTEWSWKEGNYKSRPRPAITLFCPPGYPQSVPFVDMRERFDALRCDGDVAGCSIIGPEFDGFSYHGTESLPCVMAAALGATLIEAHMMLAEEPSELESNVSLTQHQFKGMVDNVRRMETMLV